MNRSKQKLLIKPGLFMSTLIVIVVDEYGIEALDWDIETIQMELETDGHLRIPEENLTKLACGLTVMKSDSFFHSLPDFITTCNIASNDIESVELWNPADAYEITSTVAEVMMLNPPDLQEGQLPFSDEIIGYIEVALREVGCLIPPNCLGFINKDNLVINDLTTVQADPTLFAAGYQIAQETSNELAQYEANVMAALKAELKSIEYEHANVEGENDNGENRRTKIPYSNW